MARSEDKFAEMCALMLADHSALLYAELEKCSCGKPVTMSHKYIPVPGYAIEKRCCDRCCAETITWATDAYVKNPGATNARELMSLYNENEWEEVRNAANIRRVVTHVEEMNKGSSYVPQREEMQ